MSMPSQPSRTAEAWTWGTGTPRVWARRRAWSSLSNGLLAYLKIAVVPSGNVTRSTPDMDHTRTSSRTAVDWPATVSRLSRSSALGFELMGAPVGWRHPGRARDTGSPRSLVGR